MSVVRVFGTNGLGDSDSVAKFAGNREKNREFYLLPKGAAPNYHALTVVYPDIGRQGAGNCRVRCREDIRLGAPIQAKLASRFVLAFDLLNKIKAATDFDDQMWGENRDRAHQRVRLRGRALARSAGLRELRKRRPRRARRPSVVSSRRRDAVGAVDCSAMRRDSASSAANSSS